MSDVIKPESFWDLVPFQGTILELIETGINISPHLIQEMNSTYVLEWFSTEGYNGEKVLITLKNSVMGDTLVKGLFHTFQPDEEHIFNAQVEAEFRNRNSGPSWEHIQGVIVLFSLNRVNLYLFPE